MAKFKWTVEFEVDETWVADGFNLTPETAKEMIERALPSAHSYETAASVKHAPRDETIAHVQGFDSARSMRRDG